MSQLRAGVVVGHVPAAWDPGRHRSGVWRPCLPLLRTNKKGRPEDRPYSTRPAVDCDVKRLELDLCLRVWRVMRPDVDVRVVP